MTDIMKDGIDELVKNCYENSTKAGWWEDQEGNDLRANPFTFSNKIALIHSELSEALEGDRKNLMDEKLPHRPATEVELADALIRIADLAGAYGLDLAGATVEKLEFNKTREDHKLENRYAEGGKSY